MTSTLPHNCPQVWSVVWRLVVQRHHVSITGSVCLPCVRHRAGQSSADSRTMQSRGSLLGQAPEEPTWYQRMFCQLSLLRHSLLDLQLQGCCAGFQRPPHVSTCCCHLHMAGARSISGCTPMPVCLPVCLPQCVWHSSVMHQLQGICSVNTVLGSKPASWPMTRRQLQRSMMGHVQGSASFGAAEISLNDRFQAVRQPCTAIS